MPVFQRQLGSQPTRFLQLSLPCVQFANYQNRIKCGLLCSQSRSPGPGMQSSWAPIPSLLHSSFSPGLGWQKGLGPACSALPFYPFLCGLLFSPSVGGVFCSLLFVFRFRCISTVVASLVYMERRFPSYLPTPPS